VKEMVTEGLAIARRDALCAEQGYRTYAYNE